MRTMSIGFFSIYFKAHRANIDTVAMDHSLFLRTLLSLLLLGLSVSLSAAKDEGKDKDEETGAIVMGVWGAFAGVFLITGTALEIRRVYKSRHSNIVENTHL